MTRLKTRSTIRSATLLLLPALFILSTISRAQAETQWRSLDPANTVLMTLPHGQVVFELAPQFAPKHVAQFSKLVRAGFYDKNKFYRVIDGFVAQAGPVQSIKDAPDLKIESQWSTAKDFSFTLAQNNDMFAEQTGFKDGFAIAHNPSENKAWLTHCPGTLAMARGTDANTASSHFYIVNGQAPRYLDRIMSIFGRVVYGMQHIQALQRTQVLEGEAAVKSQDFTPIISMQLMSDVEQSKQLIVEVAQTKGEAFKTMLEQRRTRPNAFFYKKPPPILDVCQVPVKSRLVTAKAK
jgi:peptidylprolyl isomerase